MAERRVRVRFAPSPTGALHIGGVRTALYNYLFARQHGGDLIFRIEDTDSNRFVPGAEEYILESFKWLGIPFDEGVSFGGDHGPYRQSERRDIYKKYVQVLLDAGKAYIAFDTPEELEAKRKEVANFQYDASTRLQMRNSLTLPKEEVDALIAEGKQYVVRFKIEPNEDVHVHDLIRGEVVINSSILDDKVLFHPRRQGALQVGRRAAYLSLGQYRGRPPHGGIPRHPRRGVVAFGSAACAALPCFRLGRYDASVRPPAPAAEARR